MTDDVDYAETYMQPPLHEFGIGPEQFSLIDSNDRCRGSGWSMLNNALDRAHLVLDLADATWFDELERCPRRAFVDADPLFTQAAMLSGKPTAKNMTNYPT